MLGERHRFHERLGQQGIDIFDKSRAHVCATELLQAGVLKHASETVTVADDDTGFGFIVDKEARCQRAADAIQPVVGRQLDRDIDTGMRQVPRHVIGIADDGQQIIAGRDER